MIEMSKNKKLIMQWPCDRTYAIIKNVKWIFNDIKTLWKIYAV